MTTSTLGAGLALDDDAPGCLVKYALDEVNVAGTYRHGRHGDDSYCAFRDDGTLTGLAQLVAEELDMTGTKLLTNSHRLEKISRDRVWGDYSTGGSYG